MESDSVSDKLKVLFIRGMLYYDGVSSVEYEWIKALHDRVDYDYVLLDPDKSVPEKEAAVKALGVHIYPLRYSGRNSFENHRNRVAVVRHFLQEHHYDVVHIDTDLPSRYDMAKVARESGVKRVIVHSHNAAEHLHGIQKLPGFVTYERKQIARYATDLAACSKEAAAWLFNPKDQDRVRIIHNGISRDRYVFDEAKRQKVRGQLGLDDDQLLLGNIGRLADQKNQLFLLDIFKEVLETQPQAHLLLIGSGEKEAELRAKIGELELEGKVTMVLSTDKIPDYLFAMDLFVMPSLYEGLPMTLLEAQTTGLPCLISDVISSEMDFDGLIFRKSLQEKPAAWAKEAIKLALAARGQDRRQFASQLAKLGYDNQESAEQVYQMYLGH
ncbi:glycosyltransferase [Lactobacillus sp. 23-2]|uniref:glycosyltransferase n=1 Tax=Lactobacillus sp. 23-2 TaxID=2981842 RepID=UPI003839CC01